MAMFNIKEDSTPESLDRCLVLAKDHYDEVISSGLKQNFNTAQIQTLLTSGILKIFTATYNGTLVGYFVCLLCPEVFSSTISCKELAIYVKPESRKSGLFGEMLKFVEGHMTSLGIKSMFLTFTEGHNTEMPVKFGYTPIERTYQKVLEG